MPEARHKQAVKDGWITQKQYAKLPPALLDGIVKSKKKSGKKVAGFSVAKKGEARKGAMKGARLAFDDTKQEKDKVAKRKKAQSKADKGRKGIKQGRK